MNSERITVSLPAELRREAQRVAQSAGLPLSSVVSEAIAAWLRTRLVDAWLLEFQDEFGEFDEDELRQLAADAGVPYLPPDPRTRVA